MKLAYLASAAQYVMVVARPLSSSSQIRNVAVCVAAEIDFDCDHSPESNLVLEQGLTRELINRKNNRRKSGPGGRRLGDRAGAGAKPLPHTQSPPHLHITFNKDDGEDDDTCNFVMYNHAI